MSELVDDLDFWGIPEDRPRSLDRTTLSGIIEVTTAKAALIKITQVDSPLFEKIIWFPFSQISIELMEANGFVTFTLPDWLYEDKLNDTA